MPNLGSILAAIPAILLTTIHLGFGYALIAALGYVDVNVIIGNIIEPRVMGKGLDLSTLVVFLSLVFWGWVLRQIGCARSVAVDTVMLI